MGHVAVYHLFTQSVNGYQTNTLQRIIYTHGAAWSYVYVAPVTDPSFLFYNGFSNSSTKRLLLEFSLEGDNDL